jgi:hypothetical protein
MSKFDSTTILLNRILDDIIDGHLRLPDFQRGWVWDDERIRSLLASIARDFPIGAIMLLETGGDARFSVRPVEGVELSACSYDADHLILDGQQRLTSLTQVLKLSKPVRTKDTKNRDVERYYYFDIEKALLGNDGIDEALIWVDASKKRMKNFGRDVELDLSTPDKEYQAFCFPCNQILNHNTWEKGLIKYDQVRFVRYMDFRERILEKFLLYQLPLITLHKENPKAAVCLVFEKVNTGGMSLSVFELVTATYAADGTNLREEWYGDVKKGILGIRKKLAAKPLLGEIEPTDFLQGISLLYTYEKRKGDLAVGKSAREATMVSGKREHVLATPLPAYEIWKQKLLDGFVEVDHFLHDQGFHNPAYLPYRTQLVPLAAMMVHLKERWLEPKIKEKLERWFWSGVLGELYGGAVETRIALDLQDVLEWISSADSSEPKTVVDAGFQASRLDTLRTRTSAAYRGLYTLLQRNGAQDFFWKTRIVDLDRDGRPIDIHHIFPKVWCEAKGIPPEIFNSIVNKTPISYRANRMIGGNAPSVYLENLRTDPQVQTSLADQDSILASHLIDPALLRANDFDRFYQARKTKLLSLVERAMIKTSIGQSQELPAEDETEDEIHDEQPAS